MKCTTSTELGKQWHFRKLQHFFCLISLKIFFRHRTIEYHVISINMIAKNTECIVRDFSLMVDSIENGKHDTL